MKTIRIIVVSGALLASSVTHAGLIDLTPGGYDVNNRPPAVVDFLNKVDITITRLADAEISGSTVDWSPFTLFGPGNFSIDPQGLSANVGWNLTNTYGYFMQYISVFSVGVGAEANLYAVTGPVPFQIQGSGLVTIDGQVPISIIRFYGTKAVPETVSAVPTITEPSSVGRVILRDASTNPNSIVKRAPGSDNWPITWSGVNNHQYLGFGDGGGFGGTNSIGRVSLGFSRIEGATGDSWTGFNVWGGFHAENPAQFGGKTRGILEYNGKLYAWRTPGSGATGYNEARLAVSTDNGAHWTLQGWAFTKATGIIFPSIMQAGRGYADAQDGYVYSFAARLKDDSRLKNQVPGEIDLFRVPKGQITTRASYRFYAGRDQNGPIWVTNQAARRPVYTSASVSFSPPTVLYVPQLRNYIMVISYSGGIGSDHWGLLQAPKPWGPWRQFKNFTNTPFGAGNSNLFFFSISPKWIRWISADRLQMHLIGTGFNTSPSNSDAFMKVKLTLVPQ